MAETSQAPPPELSETFKRRLHYVNEWMAQGLLTTEKFFENWNEATSSINGTYDHGDDFLRRFESIAIEDETGTKYLDETSFLSFLRQHNVFPRAFQEVEPILLRSACYFIDYPFSTQHPATFTIKELERACWWLEPRYQHLGVEPCGGGSRDFTKTDKRRLLFQSLSTERNGARLPFDPDEWRREARRRTLDISAWKMSHRNQSDHFCCDEWGDELYHDLLDVVMALQPERPLPVMGEPRDCFRPFVARMHNGAPKLREFTISPDRLRVVVRFCLYHVFGLARKDHPVHAVDLEGATDCVMRAFPQDPDIGINWPMFDEGCRAAVCI
ncbi:hypothetical protein N7512_004095 [Penicillium capsulatum]|nr:hypothetical protein N7512_004095 [Penicillium capsulatum]